MGDDLKRGSIGMVLATTDSVIVLMEVARKRASSNVLTNLCCCGGPAVDVHISVFQSCNECILM